MKIGLNVKAVSSSPPRHKLMKLHSLELGGKFPDFEPTARRKVPYSFIPETSEQADARSTSGQTRSFAAFQENENYTPPKRLGIENEMDDLSSRKSCQKGSVVASRNLEDKDHHLDINLPSLGNIDSHDSQKSRLDKRTSSDVSPAHCFRHDHPAKPSLKTPHLDVGSKDGSASSIEIPFFFNVSPQGMAKHGAHLKRPSQQFEYLRKSTPVASVKKPVKNLIRPSGGYPRPIVLLGAFLLHFAFGYVYSWGSISPYIAFFFKGDYQQSYYLDVASYSTLIFLAVAVGYTFTEKLVNAFGFRKSVALSFLGVFLMFSLCALLNAPMAYSCIMTFVAGFFLGLGYNIPYYTAVQYFPHRSTLLKAFFYLFDGLGAFYFGYTSHLFLGLDDSPPAEGDYYPESIREKIPGLVEELGINLLVLGLVGSLAMKPRFNFVETDWSALKDKEESLLKHRRSVPGSKKPRGTKALFRDLKHALMSPASRVLFQVVIFTSVLATYYLCSYKIVGLEMGFSERYLTIMGSAGMVVMSFGKILGLLALKRISFKGCMKNIVFIQAILGFLALGTYQYFLPYFIPLMFVSGLIDALIREEVKTAFSDELECGMTAVMMVGLTIANFMAFTLVKISEYVITDHKFVNLILILPLIRAWFVIKRYAGEVKDRASIAESEVARMLED